MLDPTALPLLIRTLDFLFDEASKILRERRERRSAMQESTQIGKHGSLENSPSKLETKAIHSKEEALKTQITDSAWSAAEDEVKHFLSLLEIYKRNYYLAKEQYALFGGALVPQIVVHNLAEAEDGIATYSEKLYMALNNIYGQEVLVPEISS